MTQLLTVKQAAELLGLKVATIRAWLYRRRLPCVRCGRAVRVPADAVAQFIERNTIPAREERP
jgi:excisionase family DNA binding protein